MSTPNTPSLMPDPAEFQMFQTIARSAQNSGLYAGVGQEAKIFMVLLSARELGIPPMLALNGGIWNIQGKIEISARLMNGLIRRAGHSIKVIESTDTTCTLLGKRTDGDSVECTFTIEDATKAGLHKSNTYMKYPADMLYNRCMSRLARRLFSDVIGTAYIEGEIKDAKEVEAKEKEDEAKKIRELEQAECVDVTECREGPAPSIASPTQDAPPSPKPDPSQGPKIDMDQLTDLESLYEKTDVHFKANFMAHIKKEWKAKALHEIPASCFGIAKRGMEMNIKKIAEATQKEGE